MLGEVGGAYHGDVGMLEQEWLDRLVAAHRRTSVTSRERPELTKPLGYGRREAYLKELRTRANTHRSNGAVTRHKWAWDEAITVARRHVTGASPGNSAESMGVEGGESARGG